MKELKSNHLAILVSVIILSVLGFVWYGPLFGETWMRLEGLDPAVVEQNPPGAGTWITNLVATVVPLYIMAWMFVKMKVESGMQGALIGLLIGFGFMLLSRMTNDLFAQRPYELTWIVGGLNIVSLVVGGFILGAWRKYKS